MRCTAPLTLALVAGVTALDFSQSHDTNSSVWSAVAKAPASASSSQLLSSRLWNRPSKRQTGWSPPSNLANALQEVWNHCMSTYSNFWGFKNYGWDQIHATGGKINVCVRWESSATITEAQRAQVASVYAAQYQKWFSWLYGYDNFPYSKIDVNVVGWAVRDKSLLQGSTAGITVYTDTDSEGAPQCSEACGRFFHQDGNYNSCPGGASAHYDQSLWLTDGWSGGAGGDWGQRIGREYFIGSLGSSNVHILLHEMGHTFGLDDFYDWLPTGQTNFIMNAGSATVITDFDGWMLRNWWNGLSRYRGWQ